MSVGIDWTSHALQSGDDPETLGKDRVAERKRISNTLILNTKTISLLLRFCLVYQSEL